MGKPAVARLLPVSTGGNGAAQMAEGYGDLRMAIAGALRLLAAHPRSEKDLRQRLRRRGLPPPAVDAAAERVKELGYLDDTAFARFWVDSRQAATPRSRRYVLFELDIQEALGTVYEGKRPVRQRWLVPA